MQELISLIALVASVVVLIMFIVMAVNVGTIVSLLRGQNKILQEIFKQNGGTVIDKVTGKEL